MAVNGYFNNYPSQQRTHNEFSLMEDVIVESIKIMGHNVYYIPRESFDEGDMVFGEYSKSAFNKAYLIEAYLSNVMEHGGQGDFFSKFGLEIRDNDNFILSRRSFLNTLPTTIRTRPQEGDLVYVPVLHKMYEIKFVEHELMFHSIGKKLPFVYEMKCEAFRASHEPIQTGVAEVDQVGIDSAYTIDLVLDGTNFGNFYVGEVVYQTTDTTPSHSWSDEYVYATIKTWTANGNVMTIYNISGEFVVGQPVVGNSSYKSANLVSIGTENAGKYDLIDNELVYNDAEAILDFSETNPFGNP